MWLSSLLLVSHGLSDNITWKFPIVYHSFPKQIIVQFKLHLSIYNIWTVRHKFATNLLKNTTWKSRQMQLNVVVNSDNIKWDWRSDHGKRSGLSSDWLQVAIFKSKLSTEALAFAMLSMVTTRTISLKIPYFLLDIKYRIYIVLQLQNRHLCLIWGPRLKS